MDWRVNNLFKNDQIAMSIISGGHREFYEEILQWHKKFNPQAKKFISIFDCEPRNMGKILRENHKKTIKFMERLSKENNALFLNILRWMENFIKKYEPYGLGRHWKITIWRMVATGFYYPPDSNFYVYPDKNRNKVIIEIDSRTSLNDFKKSWKYEIEKSQSQLKKYPKIRLKKKFAKHLDLLFRATRLNKKSFSDAYGKITDLDRIGKLYPDVNGTSFFETDQKRADQIRVIRHRIRKKLQ